MNAKQRKQIKKKSIFVVQTHLLAPRFLPSPDSSEELPDPEEESEPDSEELEPSSDEVSSSADVTSSSLSSSLSLPRPQNLEACKMKSEIQCEKMNNKSAKSKLQLHHRAAIAKQGVAAARK